MKQYSKRVVMAHWLTLILVIIAWYLGEDLAEATDDHKSTLAGFIFHMSAGGLVFLVTIVRLYFRSHDGVPPPMGTTLIDKIAKGIHHALYTALVLLPLTGIGIVLSSSVGKALLTGNAALLPKDFDDVFIHEVHEALVSVLIGLVVVHVLGAIKHHFIDKDGLMERMSLRRND